MNDKNFIEELTSLIKELISSLFDSLIFILPYAVSFFHNL